MSHCPTIRSAPPIPDLGRAAPPHLEAMDGGSGYPAQTLTLDAFTTQEQPMPVARPAPTPIAGPTRQSPPLSSLPDARIVPAAGSDGDEVKGARGRAGSDGGWGAARVS
jgi:hypothetical protein